MFQSPESLILQEVIRLFDNFKSRKLSLQECFRCVNRLFLNVMKIFILLTIKNGMTDISGTKKIGWALISTLVYRREIYEKGSPLWESVCVLHKHHSVIPYYVTQCANKGSQILYRLPLIHSHLDDIISKKAVELSTNDIHCTYNLLPSDDMMEYKKLECSEPYESKNYKMLFETIQNNITASKSLRSSGAIGILLNGEPGLGKSMFADYLSHKNIVDRVNVIDLSKLCEFKFGDEIEPFISYSCQESQSTSTVLMIDEIDKYLDHRRNHIELKETVDGKVRMLTKREMQNKKVKISSSILLSILSLIDSKTTFPLIVIFCSNNFHTLFQDINQTHYHSLIDRLIQIRFERCDSLEVKDYLRYINTRFERTSLYNGDIEDSLQQLNDDTTITFRKLVHTVIKCRYRIDDVVKKLNDRDSLLDDVILEPSFEQVLPSDDAFDEQLSSDSPMNDNCVDLDGVDSDDVRSPIRDCSNDDKSAKFRKTLLEYIDQINDTTGENNKLDIVKNMFEFMFVKNRIITENLFESSQRFKDAALSKVKEFFTDYPDKLEKYRILSLKYI